MISLSMQSDSRTIMNTNLFMELSLKCVCMIKTYIKHNNVIIAIVNPIKMNILDFRYEQGQ